MVSYQLKCLQQDLIGKYDFTNKTTNETSDISKHYNNGINLKLHGLPSYLNVIVIIWAMT